MNKKTVKVKEMFYKGLSNKEISKEMGITERGVRYHLKKLGLNQKERNKKELQEKIKELYNQGYSPKEVNKILNITTTSYYLELMGIRKNRSEAMINSIPKRYPDFEINQYLIDVIEGNLLGDGCISENGKGRSAFYQHAGKYKEHIIWLKFIFEENGIKTSKIYKRKAHMKLMDVDERCYIANFNDSYSFQSAAFPSMLKLRNEWYKEKKIIPNDFELNNIKLLHWFIGDGGIAKYKNGKISTINLHTLCFNYDEIEHLQNELLKMGIESRIRESHANKQQYFIQIGKQSNINKFYEIIGECPKEINCYSYKWKTVH